MQRPLARPMTRGGGSLGGKLVRLLTLVGVGGAIAITLLLIGVITPSFNQLENRAVHGHVERMQAALAEYASKVESAVRDYGDWTASYDYMARPSAAFERDSFSTLAMANLGVEGMAYVAPDGRVVVARWRDLASGAERPEMRGQLIAMIGRVPFARVLAGRSSGRFYARLGDVVAAVGVAQIRRSDGTGAPRGHVLMARVISSQRLSELLQLDARIDPAARGDGAVVGRRARAVDIAVPIRGADGHAVAAARFSVPRAVSNLGRRMVLLAVAGSTMLLLIVLMVLRRAIARLVLAPLRRVEAHMQRVRVSGSLTLLDEEGARSDEIASLGRSFNAMLRQLKDLREQIEIQSFALGRSESAVAVMHNVRNALNPISTILSQGIAQAPPVERGMLDRAVAELAGGDVSPERREKLAAFVAAGLEAQVQAREAMRSELVVGREAMAHVLDIIGQQQAQAHERPPLDACDVTEIIARNATIARYSEGVSIAFTFPATPAPVLASRVILSQVIGNLFGNAAEAIAATGRDHGSIIVAIEQTGERTTIRINDDGEGFDADTAATLFQRGFSTRAHKSGGLGLHWCANSMVAMGGALHLHSRGRGLGAEAVLTLASVPADALATAA